MTEIVINGLKIDAEIERKALKNPFWPHDTAITHHFECDGKPDIIDLLLVYSPDEPQVSIFIPSEKLAINGLIGNIDYPFSSTTGRKATFSVWSNNCSELRRSEVYTVI